MSRKSTNPPGAPPISRDGEARAVATLAIRDAATMTTAGRRDVAAWLRAQANALDSEGDQYAPRFGARYLATRK